MTHFLDLENGYMVTGESNLWQTDVKCILARTNGQNEKQYAWLSQECRAESVSPDIFGTSENYEFVVIKGWNGFVSLRSGSSNYDFNPIRNFLGKAPETTYIIGGSAVEAHCNMRKVRILNFDEALEFFQKEDESKTNKIYMLIEYEIGSCKYELYAPCRYTNYPQTLSNEKYLQPNSGYVLFEEREKFYLSYVAAHLREDGTRSVEFRIREMTSFINTKNKSSRLYPVFNLLDFLFLRFFFVMDDFTRIKKFHNAKCALFVYDDR